MNAPAYKFVERCSTGTRFKTVDPSSLPYGMNAFEDEEEVRARFWTGIGPDSRVVDAGASWGAYALPALARGARVVAVEPADEPISVLRASAEANGWGDDLDVVKAVLWDGSEYPRALYDEVFGKHYPVGAEPPIRTLDSLDLEVTHLKIDVESAELGVLRGAIATLRRCRPFLLVEDHAGLDLFPACTEESSSAPIREMLRGLGYRLEFAPYLQRSFIAGYPS